MHMAARSGLVEMLEVLVKHPVLGGPLVDESGKPTHLNKVLCAA